MFQVSAQQIQKHFDYREFVPYLNSFFKKEVVSPDRSHFDIPVSDAKNATLLTMPAWSVDEYIGVKIVNIFPDNSNISSINGSYLLMSGKTGELLCVIDGLGLTIKRTASVSALASQILSPPEASSLCMLGTGNLSTEFIKAHNTVRNFSDIYIWGRNFEKAKAKAEILEKEGVSVKAIQNKEDYFPLSDIISCATLSYEPIVIGDLCKKEVYIDLVGSFQKTSREADDNCLRKANIYVDTHKAMEESGDLFIPLKNGVITKDCICADLVELCQTNNLNKNHNFDKTVFKSVGFATPDLAAAVYLYSKMV